jgi:DEAD/DEAH box helicase domain-containing protein
MRTGRRSSPVAVWAGRGFPAHGIGLRSGSGGEFRIVREDGTPVGTVDEGRAFEVVHPGAVYLHQGQAFRIVELDLVDRQAIAEPCDGGEYTVTRTESDVRLTETERRRSVGRTELALGGVEVTVRVVGFQRRDRFTGEMLGTEPLDLPTTTLTTRAIWYVVDPEVLTDAAVAPSAWPGTLHAVEHAAIGILPLFTICDRWDVGGVSTVFQADTARPTIVIYDGYPGGAGVAELGFDTADRHLAATLEVIDTCSCASGCPSCVQSPKCGNWNEPLDKHGARALLAHVLAAGRD